MTVNRMNEVNMFVQGDLMRPFFGFIGGKDYFVIVDLGRETFTSHARLDREFSAFFTWASEKVFEHCDDKHIPANMAGVFIGTPEDLKQALEEQFAVNTPEPRAKSQEPKANNQKLKAGPQ